MQSGVRVGFPIVSTPARPTEFDPESWLSIKDAIGLIMELRNVGPKYAKTLLREACGAQTVRSRRLAAIKNERNEKVISFPPLPPDAWGSWGTISVDANTIHTFEFGELDHVQINERELTARLSRPRRGPAAGKIARYANDDRALFASIDRKMKGSNKSLTEAVRDLDYEQKVKGRGTPESRIRRVTRLFRKERGPVR